MKRIFLFAQRAENIIHQFGGIIAMAGADLLGKKVFDVFGQGDFHASKLHFIRLVHKVCVGTRSCVFRSRNMRAEQNIGRRGSDRPAGFSKTFILYDGANLGTART